MGEEGRINVDTLVKGTYVYPRGAYIGGELTVLRAKLPGEPLVFHLSTKSRQGRFTIIVQCAKFSAPLNGIGVLEEAHAFLEKKFRQYIRIQADCGSLEVLGIVRIRGGPKRVDIRYGLGGTILAQDGTSIHLRDDSEAASWFPSQSSSEAAAKGSLEEQHSTTTPPAAQNSPLAAFPVSPPTSEPPISTGKIKSAGVRLEHQLRETSSRSEADSTTERHSKRRRVDETPFGTISSHGVARAAVRKGKAKQDTSGTLDVPEETLGFTKDRTDAIVQVPGRDAIDGKASKESPVDLPIVQSTVATEHSSMATDPAPSIRVSELLANPALLLSLSIQQREALRRAAERKWLERHPSPKPQICGSLERLDSRIADVAVEVAADLKDHPALNEAQKVDMANAEDGSTHEDIESTKAHERALAETGGLVVSRTAASREIEYPSLGVLIHEHANASPLRNVMAVVRESYEPRVIGFRGDVLQRLRLIDPSHPQPGPWLSLFSRGEEPRLPANIPPGSVVLVRDVKVSRDGDVTLKCPAHANWTYCFLLSPDSSQVFVEGEGRRGFSIAPLTSAEREKMKRLQHWYNARFNYDSPHVQPNATSTEDHDSSEADKTWKTVVNRDFCNLTVEVIYIYPTQFPTKREFLVTDYTKNDSFKFDGQHAPDIPEVGYLTLLTLWDRVATSADRDVINDGDIVHFRNVAIKDSTTSRYGIEGNVREFLDASGQGYRRFRVLDPQKDHRARALVERRERLKADMRAKLSLESALRSPSDVPPSLGENQLDFLDSSSVELGTRHHQQPFSRIPDVISNPVLENMFRLKAWVGRIQTRKTAADGKESRRVQDLVVRRCKLCDRYLEDKLCDSCKKSSANLEYQYLFVVHLQEGKDTAGPWLPVIISSKYMSGVLPILPAVTVAGTDEENAVVLACRKVEEMLQGAILNGKKQCPAIDWSFARSGVMNGANRVEGLFAIGMAVRSEE